MELTFQGKAKRLDRKTIRKAVKYFAYQLMHPRLIENLDIQVLFKDLCSEEGVYGYCDFDDVGTRHPRYFRLEIDDSLTPRMTLRTLGHEMVHVRQYATGELKDYVRKSGKVRWRGKEISFDEKKYDTKKEGNKYPYEKEALRLEKTLYKSFKEYINGRNN